MAGATPSLTRADWAEAAIRALAAGGVRAIAVAPLARSLGVTKGSFYWHFESRAELVDAALELWEAVATRDVIDILDAIADPRERLAALFTEALNPEHIDIEVGIQSAAALGDPVVATAYAKVSRMRLDYIARLYTELGQEVPDARHAALAAYAAYVGTLQLLRVHPEELSGERLQRQVKHLIAVYVPPVSRPPAPGTGGDP